MVYLFLAEGFEESEALVPLDMLRRAKVEVKTVGVTGSEVKGSHGIRVIADISPEEVGEEIDMVILPGGMPGTTNLEADETVQAAIDRAAEKGKLIAAICAAPMILGNKGLLEGKDAICYTGFEKFLKGANIVTERGVVRDGNIITARGAGVAMQFGFALVAALCGNEAAEEVKKAVLY